MRFIDEVVLDVRAGDGGDGCVAFRREAHVPRGGPAGGDGGRGGDVVLQVEPQMGTLLDLYYHPHQRAEHGKAGGGSNRSGRYGASRTIKVPAGTVAIDASTDEVIADMVERDARQVIAKGGNGGWGNQRFATSTRQAPDFANSGQPGEHRKIRLVLKLIADIGLAGLPNAGKSTLISKISAARPKIADYPFTTLHPKLGVVGVGDDLSFVVADIPGLIEGASAGAGLGHRFLRHIERVGLIVHLVEASPEVERDPIVDYQTIRSELEAYSSTLGALEEVVVMTKNDLDDGAVLAEHLQSHLGDRPFFSISAVTGDGISELVGHLAQRVAQQRQEKEAAAQKSSQKDLPQNASQEIPPQESSFDESDSDEDEAGS